MANRQRAGGRAKKEPRTLRPAPDCPVARVAVDIPLAHLDRPFDYLVPERLAAQALPGVRVRVRFAGQLTDGFILERASASEHQGRLSYLERVVSAEQVLTPEIAGLARAVADRYAGTLADVLRLAIPQRHAATEAKQPPDGDQTSRRTETSRPARAGIPGASRRLARSPAPGTGTPRAWRSSTRCTTGGPPALRGQRCRARPGRRR